MWEGRVTVGSRGHSRVWAGWVGVAWGGQGRVGWGWVGVGQHAVGLRPVDRGSDPLPTNPGSFETSNEALLRSQTLCANPFGGPFRCLDADVGT